MADTTTTNLSLIKPEPGGAEDTWGVSLNSDLDTLDAIFSSAGTQVNLNPNQVNFADDKKTIFGTDNDLTIDHSSATGVSRIIDKSGILNIQQSSDDGQIRFQCDDGSGGVTTYYQIAGSNETNIFFKDIKLSDGLKANFGASNDLQIFHEGTFSNIKDQGQGILQLTTNGDAVQIYDSTNTTTMARFNTGGSVNLNYAGTQRFQTTANGINVNGTVISDAEAAFSTTANSPNASLVVGNTASINASGEYKGAVGFARGSDTLQVRSAIVGKQTDTSANKQGLAFLVHPNSVAGTLNEALLITHGSKIGIGTTSPSEILTVAGNIANVSGDMTLDVAGDIILDADDGFINLKDGGTEFGTLFKSSDSFFIKNPIVDGDIKFQVNDGGSGVVAFQIDASDAGTVIFNNKVGIGTTSPSSILDVAGSAPILTITDTRDQSFSVGDTMSSLAFDSEDQSGGAGSSGHPRATINLIAENTFGSATGLAFKTKGDTNDAAIERLRITSDGNLDIPDNHKLRLGDSRDLLIYHDGNDSRVQELGTGNLLIDGQNRVNIRRADNGNFMGSFIAGGAVELYHDAGKRLETTSVGATVTGKVTATNVNPDIICVGVAYFASDGSTNRASGISCTRNSTGVYAITFDTARSDANYIVTGQVIEPAADKDDVKIHVEGGSQTTTGFTVNIYEGDNGGSPDTPRDRDFYITIMDVV